MRALAGVVLGLGVVGVSVWAQQPAPHASIAAPAPPRDDTGRLALRGDTAWVEDPSPPFGDTAATVLGGEDLSQGSLIITEVMASPLGCLSLSSGQYIEVYNPLSVPVRLDGLRLFVSGRAPASLFGRTRIAPGDYGLILPRDTVPPCMSLTPAAEAHQGPWFDPWRAVSVSLTTQGGRLIDAVSAIGPATRGRSLELDPAHLSAVDNDLRSSWCEGQDPIPGNVASTGSPGLPNHCLLPVFADTGDTGPTSPIELRVGTASPGSALRLEVRGVSPGDEVVFFASRTGLGAGWCAPRGGPCTRLADDQRVGRVVADAQGTASVTHMVPAVLAVGTPLWMQAVVNGTAGYALSGVVQREVVP